MDRDAGLSLKTDNGFPHSIMWGHAVACGETQRLATGESVWRQATGDSQTSAARCLRPLAVACSLSSVARRTAPGYGATVRRAMLGVSGLAVACGLSPVARRTSLEQLDIAGARAAALLAVLLRLCTRVFRRGAVYHELEDLSFFFGSIQASQGAEQSFPLLSLRGLRAIAHEHRERGEAVPNVSEPLRQFVIELKGNDRRGNLFANCRDMSIDCCRGGLLHFSRNLIHDGADRSRGVCKSREGFDEGIDRLIGLRHRRFHLRLAQLEHVRHLLFRSPALGNFAGLRVTGLDRFAEHSHD
jgi:hypothetical protein